MKALAAILLALLLASFCGDVHPLGDSLAVFRVPLALLALGAGLLTRRPGWLLAVSGTAALVLGGHLWSGRGAALTPDRAPVFTLYQQNLLWNRGVVGPRWLAAVEAASPDALTLQEVSDGNQIVLDALRADYPTQVSCPGPKIGGPAVLSRWPAMPGTAFCNTLDRLAMVQVQTPAGPVWVVSLHQRWPWPDGQGPQSRRLAADLARVRGDAVVIGGDFNAVAWARSVARIARASGAQRVGPHGTTFHIPPVDWPVGIDHVLGTFPALSVQVMPKFASDHHGLLVVFAQP